MSIGSNLGSILDGVDPWGEAYQQLASEQVSLVRAYERLWSAEIDVPSDARIQERAQAILLVKQKQILQKQWKIQWGHRTIKVRAQVDRVVKLINGFKEVGTTAANADPVHAGLPWAGICFLLVVSMMLLAIDLQANRILSQS